VRLGTDRALVPEVGLLRLLLASHLPLGNRRLAVTTEVASAPGAASLPGPYLGAVFKRAGSPLFGKENLMVSMLPAKRAETLDGFWELHFSASGRIRGMFKKVAEGGRQGRPPPP